MRVWIALIGVAVFAAMLLIDPVALGRLGYACAAGGCGVRPVWLGGLALAVALVWVLRAVRRPRAAAGKAKRAGARRARRTPRAAAAAKPRAASAKRPRRTP